MGYKWIILLAVFAVLPLQAEDKYSYELKIETKMNCYVGHSGENEFFIDVYSNAGKIEEELEDYRASEFVVETLKFTSTSSNENVKIVISDWDPLWDNLRGMCQVSLSAKGPATAVAVCPGKGQGQGEVRCPEGTKLTLTKKN